MADNRTMAELLRAPTEGCSLPVARKRTPAFYYHLGGSSFKIHQCILSPSRITSLRNEISNFQQKFDESFHEAWDRYKDLLRACPHHGFTELHQLDTFYNALNPADQDSLNAAAGGNLLERSNQQTSAVTTAMRAMLKQFQATPHPASVKAVEEIYVTYGGAHLYYQCLAAGGNTFLEFRDNIQGYVSAAAINYNQGSGSLSSNIVANSKGELKAITTHSGLVTNGPTVPTPPKSITLEVDERIEETYTAPDLVEYTIKVSPPPVQKYKPPSQREFVVHKRDPLHPNIPYPSRMLKQKQQEKDEVQIQNFWQMFKQLHINITLTDALVLMPKYQKMLKALLSNKEKLQELANTHLNENCSAVILKNLPEKLGDPGKFLISCGFCELKCNALADLANRAICTPAGIARDLFVPVGKFTFLADFVIVDHKSDPRVPLNLGRPFLRIACALIDVHGEEMILRDGDERLTLNMKHDTSSYSNQPQRESVNLINIFNVSKGCNVLSEKLPDLKYTKDTHPPLDDNLLKIEFLLYQDKDSSLKDPIDQKGLANLDAIFVDPIPEMFTDEHTLDYLSPLKFDVYDDDFLEVEFDAKNVYDDPFDSKGKKIKESKLLIDELDLPCDFLPPFEYDSFISQAFSRVDAFPSTNNEDKVFNPGIIIQEKPIKIITRVAQDKKIAISNDSLVLEDFNPPFYEPLFFKEVPKAKMLLPFSFENEEKVFQPGIYTSEKGRFVTAVKLNRGLRDSNYDQLFAYLKQHEAHAKKNKMMLERLSQPTAQPTADPLALLSNVSNTQHGSPSSSTSSFTQLPPPRANSSSPAVSHDFIKVLVIQYS
nr:hypothetical protein [Tanacetum cinerariifolium]